MVKHIDWLLLLIVFGLCAFGLICIANARAKPYYGNDTGLFAILGSLDLYYVIRQSIWICVGIAAMAAMMLIDYHYLSELWLYIYIASVALLIMVKLLSSGAQGGVDAWFDFEFGENIVNLQPAELVKLSMIVVGARQLTRTGTPITRVREFLPVLGIFALPLLIVVWQGELGSVMVYMAIFIGMLFLSGTSWKLLVGLGTTGLISLVPLWFVIGEFRQNRILAFFDPSLVSEDELYQVTQSMLAIGSGKATGKGFFQTGSLSQLSYVPVNHSDFIFSVTAEAVGFWGCLAIVLVYVVLILRLFWSSMKVTDRFGALLIVGVASMFLFQVFENIAMTMDLMPITGIPLPFMSYGGSAMLTNLMAIGMVQSVIMRPQKSYLANT